MLFHALGPTAVESDHGLVQLAGKRPRRLLAALLLHAGDAVPVDELVEHVWPDAVPRTAAKTLQTYVLHLRRQLGADRILTRPSGYAIRVQPAEYDVALFEAAVSRGQADVKAQRWDAACVTLRQALALWQGEPFADLAVAPAQAHRLVELRGYAVIDLARAELSSGQVRESIARLRAELASFPLREELWALLMRALHRDGRSSEALAAFEQARSVLRDELGVDPGRELRELHMAMLDDELQDDTLPHVDPTVPHLLGDERSDLQYALGERGLVSFLVFGDGEQVLLVVPDWFNTIAGLLQHPTPRRLLEQLAAGRRLVLFDTIGMGRSDPLQHGQDPSIDSWVRDALAVLDSAGVDRCAVLASSVGAAVAIQLAAQHPQRVQAIVLHNPVLRTSDTTLALIGYDEVLRLFNDKWATGTAVPSVAASRANDVDFNDWFGRFMAASVSAERLPVLLDKLVFSLDVMAYAPAARCPVLLTAREQNVILGPGGLPAVRAALPHALVRMLEGGDHLWFIDDDGGLAAAVEQFLSDSTLAAT